MGFPWPWKRSREAKAVVFVDVDGTISPSQFSGEDYFYSAWNGGHYFPQELREALEQLPAEKLWLTGWGSDAEATFACGWATVEGDRSVGDFWKHHAIEEYLARHSVTRVVWLDDELWKMEGKVGELSVPTLKICPSSAKGLSPAQVEAAATFLTS